jgi:hypothetical protein
MQFNLYVHRSARNVLKGPEREQAIKATIRGVRQCQGQIREDLGNNTRFSFVIYQGLHHSPSTRVRQETKTTQKHFTVYGFKEKGKILEQFCSMHIEQNRSVSYVRSWKRSRVGPDEVKFLAYVA